MAAKKLKPRQKIEMKRIESEEDRLMTFSKRISRVYKKASELASLSGAEVAVVVFSPTGEPFSFGHPSVESVANRLLNQNPPQGETTQPLVEAHRQETINELNRQYNELTRQLKTERKRGKALKKLTQETGTKGWWETPLEGLSFQELQHRIASLEELRINLLECMQERFAGASSSSFAEQSAHGNGTNPPSFSP